MLAGTLSRRASLGSLQRTIASWSKFDPTEMSGANPAQPQNIGAFT